MGDAVSLDTLLCHRSKIINGNDAALLDLSRSRIDDAKEKEVSLWVLREISSRLVEQG